MKTDPFTGKQQDRGLECHGIPLGTNFPKGGFLFPHLFSLKTIILLVLGFFWATVSMAQKAEVVVNRTQVAPVIDGMEDEVWATAEENLIALPFGSEVPTLGALGQTWWKALWTMEGIFILVQVADDVFSPMYAGTEPFTSWMYDKPELYFDCNYIKKDAAGPAHLQGHYCIAPVPIKDQISGQKLETHPAGTAYAFNVTDPSYMVEYFIPFSTLIDKDGFEVDKTEPIGFDITIVDNDVISPMRNRMAWANSGAIDECWNNMDDAGLIVLVANSFPPIFIDKITLSEGSITTNNGTLQMSASIEPEDVIYETIRWSIINGTGRASISPTGQVTAISNGTVTVKASTTNQPLVEATAIITISGQVMDETEHSNDYNLVRNWDFSSDLTHWGYWADLGIAGQTPPVIDNGVVSMTAADANDGQFWHYQLHQRGLKAEGNVPYILKFKSWSTISKDNIVDFEDSPLNGYNRYGASTDAQSINGRSEWVYHTTTEPQWFTFHVVFDQMVPTTEQKIQWMLSNTHATTYLDSVILSKTGDPSVIPNYLDLSATQLSLDETAAFTTVNISSNASWELRSDQSWLTTSPPTGNGNQTVRFTATANQMFTNRTATITAYSIGLDPQIITVIQSAKKKIPEDPVIIDENWDSESWNTYNVIKNWNFTNDLTHWGYWADQGIAGQTPPVIDHGVVSMTAAAANDGNFWHYQFHQFGLKAEPNEPYILKFKSWSTISKANIVVFEDGPQNMYNRYGASTDAQAINGRSEWTYYTTTEPKWFTFHVVFDQMVPTTQQKLQWMLSNAHATTYLDSVILIKEGDPSINRNYLTLSATQLSVEETAASAIINITSNTDWELRTDQAWLTISPATGNGNQPVGLTARANHIYTNRTAIITVHAIGLDPQTITVIQSAKKGIPEDPVTIIENWDSESWNTYNLIKNWNFTSDLTHWGHWTDPGVSGQMEPVAADGRAEMTTGFATDGAPWHYQLNQTNLEAEAHVPYTLKFKSWSTISKVNIVVFEDDPQNGYNRYGASTDVNAYNGRSEWVYYTTTEPQWFTFHVVFDQMIPTTEQKIQWMLSTANGTTYLDSVILIKDADVLLIEEANMALSTTHLSMGPTEVNAEVNVSSNTNTMAISDQPWLSVDPPNITGNQTLNFITEANSTNETRTATVTFYPAGMASKTITVTQESTTAAYPVLEKEPFTLYPNPTAGKVKVVWDKIPTEKTYLRVNDVTGRVVLKQLIQDKEQWIDLTGRPPGIYFIRTDLKTIKVQKVILK